MVKIKLVFWYGIIYVLSFGSYIAIKIIPFKSLITRVTNTEKIIAADLSLTKRQQQRLLRVQEILERVSEKVPWRVLCFEQALVALWIARVLKLNMNIYFGIKHEEGNLLAHAWTEAGNQIFTGEEGREEFLPVYIRGYKWETPTFDDEAKKRS